MKLIKTIIGIAIFLTIFLFQGTSFGKEEIHLEPKQTEVKQGEEIVIKLKIPNISVAACDIQLFFDPEQVDYKKGPETANQVESKIQYSWFDITGGKESKQNEIITEFTFQAKKEGMASFGMLGTIANERGEEITTDFIGTTVSIQKEPETVAQSENNNVSEDNSLLDILRIGIEGISPDFKPEVKQYYVTVNESIDNLEIEAIPQNPQASVTILENKLIEGLNIITIEVVAKDKSNKTSYTIEVTKTRDREAANTDLETLAIENTELYPAFSNNQNQYKTEVSHDTKQLNLLAIPSNPSANVRVIGNDSLQTGNNEIEVMVTAANGYTTKKIQITAYKKTIEEELIEEQEKNKEVEKLNAILKNEEQEMTKINENVIENKKINWLILLGLISSIIMTIIIVKIKEKDRK